MGKLSKARNRPENARKLTLIQNHAFDLILFLQINYVSHQCVFQNNYITYMLKLYIICVLAKRLSVVLVQYN